MKWKTLARITVLTLAPLELLSIFAWGISLDWFCLIQGTLGLIYATIIAFKVEQANGPCGWSLPKKFTKLDSKTWVISFNPTKDAEDYSEIWITAESLTPSSGRENTILIVNGAILEFPHGIASGMVADTAI